MSDITFTSSKPIKIALVGNPNSGKSTLFNALTGLFQKTGNFPGVTVEKKTGITKVFNKELKRSITLSITDLPGIYSLYPKAIDELESYKVICDPENDDHPDIAVVVVDSTNLRRGLLLTTQIIDLKIPVVLALNMTDLANQKGLTINQQQLVETLGIKVVAINAREGKGIDELKRELIDYFTINKIDFIDFKKYATDLLEQVRETVACNSYYSAFQVVKELDRIPYFTKRPDLYGKIMQLKKLYAPNLTEISKDEMMERYAKIDLLIDDVVTQDSTVVSPTEENTSKLDKVLTHKIWGFLIFAVLMLLVFQAIFSWSAYPMDAIEMLFAKLSSYLQKTLPQGLLNELLTGGIIPGISGVLMFVPQIALLFGFIALLEDSGYMARVSFIMDKLMARVGLNGRSVIPLISGLACAVPAILSTRTISNPKERLITILITPLMSCSARIPVYTLLIALVIPEKTVAGLFNLQGLVFFALYFMGMFMAILTALLLKWLVNAKQRSVFIMELPVYRLPKIKTVLLTMYDKVKVFITDAGGIIIAISVVLFFLSTHAPSGKFDAIDVKYSQIVSNAEKADSLGRAKSSEKLTASYIGILGQAIEPAIRPLGFDWKIGIAVITSLAAREVFVGTMATIYSANDDGDFVSLKQKMQLERNPNTGQPVYTAAVGISIMIFYVFALQCMSTLAVVFRETRKLYIPLLQFVYMGALAYLGSFIAYTLLR